MEAEVIDDAYLQCQQICKNASTTFYSSFSALGYEKRRACTCSLRIVQVGR